MVQGSGLVIEGEDDVRAWVRDAAEGKARWVEPALGSTSGLPDCWVPVDGRCVWAELKCGVITGEELRFKVRPEQRREIGAMLRDQVPVIVVVGVKGTDLVACFWPHADVLRGRVACHGAGFYRSYIISNRKTFKLEVILKVLNSEKDVS